MEKYKDTNITTFHLAEGPGGFVEASNLYEKTLMINISLSFLDDDNDNVPGGKVTFSKKINILSKKALKVMVTFIILKIINIMDAVLKEKLTS